MDEIKDSSPAAPGPVDGTGQDEGGEKGTSRLPEAEDGPATFEDFMASVTNCLNKGGPDVAERVSEYFRRHLQAVSQETGALVIQLRGGLLTPASQLLGRKERDEYFRDLGGSRGEGPLKYQTTAHSLELPKKGWSAQAGVTIETSVIRRATHVVVRLSRDPEVAPGLFWEPKTLAVIWRDLVLMGGIPTRGIVSADDYDYHIRDTNVALPPDLLRLMKSPDGLSEDSLNLHFGWWGPAEG